MMALIARVYRSEPVERRRAVRYPMEVGATLRSAEGEPIDVLIYDLSLTGFRMEFRSLQRLHMAPRKEFEAKIEQGRALLDRTLQSVRDIGPDCLA